MFASISSPIFKLENNIIVSCDNLSLPSISMLVNCSDNALVIVKNFIKINNIKSFILLKNLFNKFISVDILFGSKYLFFVINFQGFVSSDKIIFLNFLLLNTFLPVKAI